MSESKSSLPVPSGPVIDHATGKPSRKKAATGVDEGAFAAQLLSGGEKRGLKGGPETLERAKTTYLKSEYSGSNDRRPRPGRVTKTEI
ncbi:hypothetical protein ABI_26250 [Asticcacaulis biprosthecium C19]|uniref:Uncharacterized protein n=1 Tax=Asticcacaulis biprosthecium C19 TaxID=715226 RepID=F4QPF2_9CAUL|nr:hypothetical protein [Asticcacaulis biprosthecium]EGF91210.1 hypothetical protein ABI_26250 [Asticcacaulis biprosthecium C19]